MLKKIHYSTQTINQHDIDEVVRVLKSDFLSQGPAVNEFEKEICAYTGAKYCVSVSSGTAALHLATAVLSIEKGKKGITSPITFMATPNSMLYNGLVPEFSDIDPHTYCLCPNQLKKNINSDTRLIVPVHFAGQPAEMDRISQLAGSDIFLIEDASHALGSRYKDGSMVGNCKFSDLTTFSFHPLKNILISPKKQNMPYLVF